MKKELMALSALSMLLTESCVHKNNDLSQEELKKAGELMYVDLPDIEDDKAYFYINTDKNEITPEYMGYQYIDNSPDAAERIMPKQNKMSIAKWRDRLLDFQALDPNGRVRE